MISVIVPFWNSEQWLGRCCESLHKQDGDYLFLLIDDHSTDNSRDIAYDYCYKDQRFILMSNQHTKGVSGARNTGLDYAIQSGDWITFLDADDEMQPNALRNYETLIRSGKAQIYQANHLRYYAELNRTALKYSNLEGYYGINDLPKAWVVIWNKIYSVSLIKDICFDEALSFGEDELFNLECFNLGCKIYHADASVITIMKHFENKQSLSRVRSLDSLFAFAQALMGLIRRANSIELRYRLCLRLSELWGSKTFLKTIAPRP